MEMPQCSRRSERCDNRRDPKLINSWPELMALMTPFVEKKGYKSSIPESEWPQIEEVLETSVSATRRFGNSLVEV